jgi:hypothetical protein
MYGHLVQLFMVIVHLILGYHLSLHQDLIQIQHNAHISMDLLINSFIRPTVATNLPFYSVHLHRTFIHYMANFNN